MTTYSIVALGGDGIGPEVLGAGLDVLNAIGKVEGVKFDVSEDLLHGASWDKYGVFCRPETIDKCRQADAILVGAVGGPKWDHIKVPGGPAEQDCLIKLRQELDVYAGLRPAKTFEALLDLIPYRPQFVSGTDMMILREMCGGVYFAEPRGVESNGSQRNAFDTTRYSECEIERIARVGFALARRRNGNLVSVDKTNVMESSVLWREVVTEVSHEFDDVTLVNFYADNASYQMARNPLAFDVILGDNLFGDMLSDQAAVFAGSLGMLPSANLCGLQNVRQGMRSAIYEPVHGSAPDIAGQGIANPVGMILSIAMMFEYSFHRKDITTKMEAAVERALMQGLRTPDLGGDATTEMMTDAIIANY